MEIKKISFKDSLNLENKLYIDVRTSEEYKIDHIPNAINIPLLDEEERKKIGILYKTYGSEIARRKGVDLITPKLQKLIDLMLEKTKNFQNIIFYCSRGGLRSYSMASFYSMVSDKKIYTIERGYKGFRNYILNFFNNLEQEIKGKFLVVDGLTGSGKTLILNTLKNQNLPVIDLEALATHRGSAFGKIGITQDTNQKKFESNLWKELFNLKEEKIIIIEGESKKIGRINLPEGFYKLMKNSPHIWLETSLENRIEILYNDYLNNKPNDKEIEEAIFRIKDFCSKKIIENMLILLKNKDYKSLIKELIENYYDKLYHKKRLKFEDFYKIIHYENIDEGVNKLKNVFYEIVEKK